MPVKLLTMARAVRSLSHIHLDRLARVVALFAAVVLLREEIYPISIIQLDLRKVDLKDTISALDLRSQSLIESGKSTLTVLYYEGYLLADLRTGIGNSKDRLVVFGRNRCCGSREFSAAIKKSKRPVIVKAFRSVNLFKNKTSFKSILKAGRTPNEFLNPPSEVFGFPDSLLIYAAKGTYSFPPGERSHQSVLLGVLSSFASLLASSIESGHNIAFLTTGSIPSSVLGTIAARSISENLLSAASASILSFKLLSA